MNAKEYDLVKLRVKKLAGLSLDAYKAEQMMRRLDSYISRGGYDSVVSFCRAIENDSETLQLLMNFLTINVSEFFRDAEQFKVLKTKVIPDLLSKSRSLNIWSAGCSIGAEPYSVAMMLAELTPNVKHRILATDLDDESLDKAQAGGPYTDAQLEQVNSAVKIKNFSKTDEGYVVLPRFKTMIEFKRQNLLDDHFEKGFDLIMCRNVTIYFTDKTKQDLNRRFADSLNDDGVLFIGSTESLLDSESLGLKRMFASFFSRDGNTKSVGKSSAGARVKLPATKA
jgi:chemotaxis protein methyltransferase CheR